MRRLQSRNDEREVERTDGQTASQVEAASQLGLRKRNVRAGLLSTRKKHARTCNAYVVGPPPSFSDVPSPI